MLAKYMRRMRNNNLEIRIAGSSCRPQLTMNLLNLLFVRRKIAFKYDLMRSITRLYTSPAATFKESSWTFYLL